MLVSSGTRRLRFASKYGAVADLKDVKGEKICNLAKSKLRKPEATDRINYKRSQLNVLEALRLFYSFLLRASRVSTLLGRDAFCFACL